MFNNFSISKRLILGFGVLIFLLLATNLVALLHMSQFKDNLNQITTREIPEMNLAQELVNSVRSSDKLIHEYLLVDTASERERVKKGITEIRNKSDETIKKLEQMLVRDDVKAAFNTTKEYRTSLQPIYDRVYGAIDGNPAEAKRIVLKEYSPAIEKLADASAKLTGLLSTHVDETNHLANEGYQLARMISIGVTIAGALLAIFLAYWIIRSISGPLTSIQNLVSMVEQNNDFTLTADARTHDEVGKTAQAFNRLLATLRAALGEVKQSVAEVSSAATRMVNASSQSARASHMTSDSASSIAASVEEMTVSIAHVSDNAKSATSLASQAGKLSDEGGQVINNTVVEMRNIVHTIDRVSGAIGELGQQSDTISNIVQVIKDVADQTNLLALNAAIEAARAGEAGRGFAVVADEVRKLAERTAVATGEISTMIASIQTSAKSAVGAMQDTVEQVKTGRELAEHAGQSIIDIRKAANDVLSVISNIANAIDEQASAAQSISQQLESVAQGAEENSATATGTSESANHLGELAQRMAKVTDKFKT